MVAVRDKVPPCEYVMRFIACKHSTEHAYSAVDVRIAVRKMYKGVRGMPK